MGLATALAFVLAAEIFPHALSHMTVPPLPVRDVPASLFNRPANF